MSTSVVCSHLLSDRDTVASVGFLVSRSLPFVTVNTTIKVFRHALALDEVSTSDV